MGIFLKNKPSNLNTILSSGILQYLFMIILAYLVLSPFLGFPNTSHRLHLIELVEEAENIEVKTLIDHLEKSTIVNKASVKHLSPTDAVELMSDEIASELLETVIEENPFRESIIFTMDENNVKGQKEFMEQIKNEVYVDDIYSTATQKGMAMGSSSIKLSSIILMLVPLIILLFVYVNSLINWLLTTNKALVKSLAIYGSDDNFLKSIYLTKLGWQMLLGWIMALLLFILTFYLIFGNLGLQLDNIGLGKLLAVIVVPFLLLIILVFILFNIKFSNFLKHSTSHG